MFRYHGSRRFIRKRGPMPPNEVKEALERFLDDSQGVQLIRFLVRYWKDQQTVLTFREIREAILAGDVTKQMMKDWQQDYSKMVAEKMEPTWEAAMEAGALNQMAHKGLDIGYKFRKDHWAVRDWLRDRTATLVTNCTDEQRKAIRNIIADGIQNKMSTRELEKFIRPCIGLTKPQAAANLRYYNNIKKELREKHPRMTEASIEKKASEASMKYADRQLRQRAYTIAHTERAMAYEYGRYQHTKDLIAEGLMKPQKKVWSVARNESTCERCLYLDRQTVFLDDPFKESGGKEIFLPPLHPRCRCAVMYQDDELSREEERAVIDYVGPNKSYILNEKLRNGESLTKEEKEMRDNLDAALKHFPKFEGNILRTMPIGDTDALGVFIDRMRKGRVSFAEYLSFSSKKGYNDEEANVKIYVSNSKKGRNMLHYGKYENEILYERNTKFSVVDMQEADGVWYILLEEE